MDEIPDITTRAGFIARAAQLLGVEGLAARLDINRRSIHRYMNGQREVPLGVILDTIGALVEHGAEVAKLSQQGDEFHGQD